MTDYFRSRPMLISAVLCCAASLCMSVSVKLLFFFSVGFGAVLFFAVLFRADGKFIFVLAVSGVMIISCFFSLNEISGCQRADGSEAAAKMVYIENSFESEYYYVSVFEVIGSDTLPRGTKLLVYHEPVEFRCGAVLDADLTVKKIAGNNAKQYYAEKIYLSANMKRYTAAGENDRILSAVGLVREYIKDTLFENMGKSEASTVCALLMGDRSYFTDWFYSCVKGAGVAHVMVVSGMHLSILVMLFTRLAEKKINNSFGRALVIFGCVTVLSALCGFTPSILRAGLTYTIMAVGLLLKRDYVAENALGTAVTAILINSPYMLFNIAFELSVLSTFGILAAALPLLGSIKRMRLLDAGRLSWAVDIIVVSLSALIFTLPVSAAVFGYVSTVSVISNLLISIPVTVCIWICVPALIIGTVFPVIAKVLLFVAGFIVRYVNRVILFLGSQPFSTVRLPQRSALLFALSAAALFCVAVECKKLRGKRRYDAMNEKIRKEVKKKNGGGF